MSHAEWRLINSHQEHMGKTLLEYNKDTVRQHAVQLRAADTLLHGEVRWFTPPIINENAKTSSFAHLCTLEPRGSP